MLYSHNLAKPPYSNNRHFLILPIPVELANFPLQMS